MDTRVYHLAEATNMCTLDGCAGKEVVRVRMYFVEVFDDGHTLEE